MSLSTKDFSLHDKVASLDTNWEKASTASLLSDKGNAYPTQFIARAAQPADTPASIRVRVLSGEVTDVSKAAARPA